MIRKEHQYRILGKTFGDEGLRSICLEKISVLGTPQWERDIWTFILNWFSAEETVAVTTSGSTGTPKSMLLQKTHMISSAEATISFFNLQQGDIALLCLPVNFIAGKMMIVRALVGGLDLHFTEPDSSPDISNIENAKFAAMTPMQATNILKSSDGKRNLEKINTIILGGAALPFGLEEKLQNLNSDVWQTYGMTETITHIALRKVNGMNASEWYQPFQEVSLVLDNTRRLIINYPKLGIDQLLTNDLAELNQNGQFKILGRFDNVVNSGGIKLYPETIEQKLQGLLDCEFYLSGIPDETLGERLVLFIEGAKKDTSKLDEKIKSRLSGFEVPKEIIYQQTFKRTPNGKLIRSRSL